MLSEKNRSTQLWSNFLLVALFLQISAWSYEAIFNSTSINSVIFLLLDQSDYFAGLFDKLSAALLLLSFMLLLVTKRAGFLFVPFIYGIALPVCTMLLHSSFAYKYALLTSSARIGLPVALFILIKYKNKNIQLLCRSLLALTFIGHGIESMMEHPKFIDFLIEGFSNIFTYDLSESIAVQLLALIGAVDIVLAISGLIKPRAWIYAWMAAWGFITAVCRLMYFQWDGIFPMLVRSAHWALPLIVVWSILESRESEESISSLKFVKGKV